MKKALKFFGRIILGILLFIVLFLLVTGIWNAIAMQNEKDIVKDNPGQFVEVDGKNMSVYTEGPDGQADSSKHTILFLSGWGTESPYYDFKPLYSKLSDEYRCVVIEKFGYGFSDEIDGERDFDTILREDREALEKLGIEGPFVLCPHSLSGLEATLWAQKYPDEVEGIVGLDMSFGNNPKYKTLREGKAQKTLTKLNKVVKVSGINRFLLTISDNEGLSDEEVKQYIALVCKNQANDTVARENDAVSGVCDEITSSPLPDTPTIQYISADRIDNQDELKACDEIIAASKSGKRIDLNCGHYVHQYESERISTDMKEFISGLG